MADYDEDKLCWIDVETTGLVPADSLLLEVGFRLTDLDLNEIDRFHSVVGHPYAMMDQAQTEAAEVVRDMHASNGLWLACVTAYSNGITAKVVHDQLFEWINESGAAGLPLAGSSIRLDRDFLDYHMTMAANLFHYRTIDTSTLKEVCRRYNPELFKHCPAEFTETDHRVNTCLDGSIAEFGFYTENFIFDGRPEIVSLEGQANA